MPSHQVVIPVFDGIQPLDATGPHEVLMGATRLLDHLGSEKAGYRVTLVAETAGTVTSDSGMRMCPDGPLPETGEIGTLLVPGGGGSRVMTSGHPLVEWLRRAAPRAERVVSVCTGAFALAAAGLLDGLSATTHWRYAPTLAARYPAVDVRPDPIYLQQGRIWTAAGVTAGVDLALRSSRPTTEPRSRSTSRASSWSSCAGRVGRASSPDRSGRRRRDSPRSGPRRT